MNEKEFRNFLQKQRDYEDEIQQQERSLWKPILESIERHAAKMKMTLDQYIAWAETNPDPKGKKLAAIVKGIRDHSM